MVGGQLANVKAPMHSVSPRLAIALRMILFQLLNAHLAFRIVQFHDESLIESADTYVRLKQKLNERRSFPKFLALLNQEWFFATQSPGSSPPPTPSEQTNQEDDPPKIPRNRAARFKFFNESAGKQMRLSRENHDRGTISPYSKRCYVCGMRTSCHCKRCRIVLCSGSFKGGQRLIMSCWERHHRLEVVGDVYCIGCFVYISLIQSLPKITEAQRPQPTGKAGRRGRMQEASSSHQASGMSLESTRPHRRLRRS